MFEIFDVGFSELQENYSDELYRLRKETFSDRLGWKVVCVKDMEFDEFDNAATQYILGVYQGEIICSVRFITLDKPNMITHSFHDCFKDIILPSYGVESSRFFVDKARAKRAFGENFPVTKILFLAMVIWAQQHGYDGIHTIVSRAMAVILKRSGWDIKVLKEAFLNEHERIYLLYLPAGKKDKEKMLLSISTQTGKMPCSIWPLKLLV